MKHKRVGRPPAITRHFAGRTRPTLGAVHSIEDQLTMREGVEGSGSRIVLRSSRAQNKGDSADEYRNECVFMNWIQCELPTEDVATSDGEGGADAPQAPAPRQHLLRQHQSQDAT